NLGDDPLGGRLRKLSLGQYDNSSGEQPTFSKYGWGQTTSVDQTPSRTSFLSPTDAKEVVITTYPADLDVIDGRIFSAAKSSNESVSPTPVFPVSPETPYGKKERNLARYSSIPLGGREVATDPYFSLFSSDSTLAVFSVQLTWNTDGWCQWSVQSRS
ncbi:Tensin-3, partial [Galemys pyrenaicus]